MLRHQHDARESSVADESRIDALATILDCSDSEVVSVTERTLGAETQSTDVIVAVSLGAFEISRVDFCHIIVRQTSAIISNVEVWLKHARKMNIKRNIWATCSSMAVYSVTSNLSDDCPNLVGIQTRTQDVECLG